MKNEAEIIKREVQDLIFKALKDLYNYADNNSVVKMIAYCNINQLHREKNILITLLRTERIKFD